MMNTIRFTLTNINDEGFGRLQARCRQSSENFACNTGYLICEDRWLPEKQSCSPNSTHLYGKKRISASEVNKDLRQIQERVAALGGSFTKEQFRAAVKGVDVNECSTSPLVSAVYLQYINEGRSLRGWSKGTECVVNSVFRNILKWQPKLRIADCNERFITELHNHLLESGLRNVSIRNNENVVYMFLNWCLRKGYDVADPGNIQRPINKTMRKSVVWLTMDEIHLLLNAKLEKKHLELCRDAFCFACFTGMRYSDVMSVKFSDIVGDKITAHIKKTRSVVTIELNKYSRAIVEKRRKESCSDTIFETRDRTTMSENIKLICKSVGICSPTSISYYKGNERIDETHPKWELISTHTARRTFICNALEMGIPPNIVMKWTGHSDYQAMKPYIDICDRAKEQAMKLFDKM